MENLDELRLQRIKYKLYFANFLATDLNLHAILRLLAIFDCFHSIVPITRRNRQRE
jgi:hypothetical protein